MSNLTINQLARAFGVSTMSLYLWRQGTATKDPMPYLVDDPKALKPRITFQVGKVRTWAKKNGREFVIDPNEVIDDADLTKAKVAKKPPSKRAKPRH